MFDESSKLMLHLCNIERKRVNEKATRLREFLVQIKLAYDFCKVHQIDQEYLKKLTNLMLLKKYMKTNAETILDCVIFRDALRENFRNIN